MRVSPLALLLVPLLLGGCGDTTATSAPTANPPAQPSAQTAGLRVLIVGDSLTAGYGLDGGDTAAYPALVERALRERGWQVRCLNGGASGDSSAGARRRLEPLLENLKPQVVVIAIGGNNGLRLQEPARLEDDLRAMIAAVRAAGSTAALAGMKIHPSAGADYQTAFDAVYPRVAAELNVPLLPWLLDGVGGVATLNQSDGLHPTAAGHQIIATHVAMWLESLLPPTAKAASTP